ncbi:ZirU family protein [Pseudomonas sp. NPDC098747]|uniref:ZirU family protein n=1 Tax=Pseudomonas sp. NPDC098747 TaxID=3364487 RepID=UPI00383BA9E6
MSAKLPKGLAKQKNVKIKAQVALAIYSFSMMVPLANVHSASKPEYSVSKTSGHGEYILHVMHTGDTLESVAKQYAISVDELREANQVLGGEWAPRAVVLPSSAIADSGVFHPLFKIYTLRKGDTLDSIAARHNRSVKELITLNSTVMPAGTIRSITEGGSLLVPVVKTADMSTNSAPSQSEQKIASTLSSLGQSLSDTEVEDRGQQLTDQAVNRVTGMATSSVGQAIEGVLNKKGTAKVGISASVESGQVDYSLDYLHPMLETETSTLFSQIGMRTSNEREIGNIGVGYRSAVNEGLMLGANMFLDQDFSRDHTRASVGVEAWAEAARLSANVYTPVSGWKDSEDHELITDPETYILQERPAKGWDVNVEGPIPGVPQLAVTGEYFEWKGDKVDALGSRGELEKDPKGYSVGVKWQPMPLVGFVAEHSEVSGSDSDFSLGMDLTWNFDLSLQEQLDSTNSFAVKPLDQARKELVTRNHEMVLEYREKSKVAPIQPLEFAVDNIEGTAGQRGQGPQVSGVQPGYSVAYSSSMPDVVAIHPTTGYLISSPTIAAASVVVSITATEIGGSGAASQSTSRSTGYQIKLKAQNHVPTATNLDIQGILQVGQKLVGSYTFADNDGDPGNDGASDASTVLWTGGATTKQTQREYLLTQADVGRVLRFSVKPKSAAGSVGELASITTASAPGVVGGGTNPPGSVVEAAIPAVSNLDIRGTLQVGQTLTGTYAFADNDGSETNDASNNASTMQWSGGGTAGITTAEYVLTSADAGKVLAFEVTAQTTIGVLGNTENITTATAPSVIGGGSNPPGSVIEVAIPAVSNLDISGTLQVGQTLTGRYVFADNDENATNDAANNASLMQWTGGGTSGNTTADYPLTSADVGKVLAFEVTAQTTAGVRGNTESITTATAPSVIGGGSNPPGSIEPAEGVPSVSGVDIAGILQVGQDLTGSYLFADNDTDPTNDAQNDASTMLWSGGGTSDADKVYRLTTSDVGKVLTFSVTAKTTAGTLGNEMSITTATAPSVGGGGSMPPGSIVDPAAIPAVSSLDIVGTLQVGETLEGKYVFADNDGDAGNDATNDRSEMRWTGGGTRGNDTASYQLTSADVGKVLAFNVRAKNAQDVFGNFARITTAEAPGAIGGGGGGTVTDPAVPLNVTIHIQGGGVLTGRPQVGQALEAQAVCEGACIPGNVTYQWMIQSQGRGGFEAIPGATDKVYTPLGSQQRRELQVSVGAAAPVQH